MGRLSKRPREAQANLSGFTFLLRPCHSYHPSPKRTSVSKDFPEDQERSGLRKKIKVKPFVQGENRGKAYLCLRRKSRGLGSDAREVKDWLHA